MRRILFIVVSLAILQQLAYTQSRRLTIQRDSSVEVIGLRSMSLRTLTDSLRKYNAGAPDLWGSACRVILMRSLHFPVASVTRFRTEYTAGAFHESVVVIVSEPVDSERVRPLSPPKGTIAPTEWTAKRQRYESAPGRFNFPKFVTDFGLQGPTSSGVRIRRDSLRSNLPLADRSAASLVAILAGDSSYIARSFAVVLLSEYFEEPVAARALLEALLDSNETVALASLMVFQSRSPRAPFDWTPSRVAIRRLLAGANPIALPRVLELLVDSGIESSVALTTLPEEGGFVSVMAGSQLMSIREPAIAYLRRATHTDYGQDAIAWQRYLADRSTAN